jgi:FMN reductase
VDLAVVAGNPKPKSRTLEAAVMVAESLELGSPETIIDVVDLGEGLLRWGDPAVGAALEAVQSSQLIVVASPTYKAAYTGLLKLFLDQIQSNGLAGVIAVPLMLGAGPGHALAPEVHLKPVLVELGATCPTRALYLLESGYKEPGALDQWLEAARPQILRSLGDLP